MINLDVFDHLGPFWARLDLFGPFQTKMIFLLSSTSTKPYFVHLRQTNLFCLNWTKRVQTGGRDKVQVHSQFLFYFVPQEKVSVASNLLSQGQVGQAKPCEEGRRDGCQVQVIQVIITIIVTF